MGEDMESLEDINLKQFPFADSNLYPYKITPDAVHALIKTREGKDTLNNAATQAVDIMNNEGLVPFDYNEKLNKRTFTAQAIDKIEQIL